MKNLLGAAVLLVAMSAGAWSSDALAGFDLPGHDQQQTEDPGKKPGKKPGDKAEKKADKAGKKAADKGAKKTGGSDDGSGGEGKGPKHGHADHPHGEPPGHQQRDRGEAPAWSGGPGRRTVEPPGQAKKDQQSPQRARGAEKGKRG